MTFDENQFPWPGKTECGVEAARERLLRLTGQFISYRSKVAFGIILLQALWLAHLAIDIYSYSHQSSAEPCDVAIVLGAAVWNERPSPVFEERINHAINLHQRGQVMAIIMTWGLVSLAIRHSCRTVL